MTDTFTHPPYHRQVRKFEGKDAEVKIERDGADVVVGTVELVVGDGCFIKLSPPLNEVTFLDFRDIRGVTAANFKVD